jgi:hypothetical protein
MQGATFCSKLTDIYVDGDVCPVREEIYRVAAAYWGGT